MGFLFSEDFAPAEPDVNDSFMAVAQTGEVDVKLDEKALRLLSGARRPSYATLAEYVNPDQFPLHTD